MATRNAASRTAAGMAVRGGLLVAFAAVCLVTRAGQAAPCPDCFAVFVMPDTQVYTMASRQPEGAAHLDLTTRWICANRAAWTEPSTGKQMPIAMVIQLGDLVQSGDLDEGGDGSLDEWIRVDAAFDNLDACGVPYLVIPGNHDVQPNNVYQGVSQGYNQYFGSQRWAGHQCADPLDCDWAAGEWFVGGGDPIPANSRNHVGGVPGPPVDQPGRHRAGVIRAPSGQRLLFLGLDLAFDFPPPAHPEENDDLAWPRSLLNAYAGVPTVVFHHALLGPTGGFVPDGAAAFQSDSIVSTEDIWTELLEPHDQILLTFNGHWIGILDGQGQVQQIRESEATLSRATGFDTFAFFRNYQGWNNFTGGGCPKAYGNGWNVIAAFDPGAQQIRVRSYRVEDVDDDCTHDGVPADPTALDMDWGLPETVLPYGFPDARPPALDNCPDVANPDQADADGDGLGDACELACADGLDNDGDSHVDYPVDPGCRDATWPTEAPQCQDGVNNDPGRDALIDFDGGASAGLPPAQQTAPDPQCAGKPWNAENTQTCGLGFELALVLLPLLLLFARRR